MWRRGFNFFNETYITCAIYLKYYSDLICEYFVMTVNDVSFKRITCRLMLCADDCCKQMCHCYSQMSFRLLKNSCFFFQEVQCKWPVSPQKIKPQCYSKYRQMYNLNTKTCLLWWIKMEYSWQFVFIYLLWCCRSVHLCCPAQGREQAPAQWWSTRDKTACTPAWACPSRQM